MKLFSLGVFDDDILIKFKNLFFLKVFFRFNLL